MNTIRLAVFFLSISLLWFNAEGGDPLTQALTEQQQADRQAIASQQRVEKLDDASRQMLEEYRQAIQELDRLKLQNDQHQRLVTAQEVELKEIDNQLITLEKTQRDIDPLMDQMFEVLSRFVELDAPFLSVERSARIDNLQAMMASAEANLPEKYRRLLEAYQIESEYSRTIEAYQGELASAEDTRLVEFLRLGRVALYYLTLDGLEAGIWDEKKKSWKILKTDYNREIQRAIRIARKQLPPDLMPLPLFSPTAVQVTEGVAK